MKTSTIFVCCLFSFLILPFGLRAQKSDAPLVLAFHVGSGIAGGVQVPGDTFLNKEDLRGLTPNIDRKPVFGITADKLFTTRFSFGAHLAFQEIQVSIYDINNVLFEKGMVRRTYLGFRGMWHYAKNEKIDLYSGIKFGTVIFSTGEIEKTGNDESELSAENNRSRLAMGFIPFGARFLVWPTLGINLETSIGAPTFVSLGVNYRF